MIALRCTRKVLKRLRVLPEDDPAEPTNALGHWYANLVFVGKHRLVLCVAERSLLSVVLYLRDLKIVEKALPDSAADLLRGLGVPQRIVGRELQHMTPIQFARTVNRTVLGSMNDLALNLKDAVQYHGYDLAESALELSEVPCGPLGMDNPARVSQRLLVRKWGA